MSILSGQKQNSSEKNLILKILFVALLMTSVIFVLHFSGEKNSMLNRTPFALDEKSKVYSNPYLEDVVHFHETNPNFSKRVINTTLINFCHQSFGISRSLSFVLLNALYLVLSGIFLMKATHILFKKTSITLLSGVLYYSNFTILFAFFAPLYTYDDILQYCFLFISLLSLLKRQWILFAFSFVFSVLIRESSLFVTPLFFVFIYRKDNRQELILLLSIVLLAIVGYLLSLHYTMGIHELWGETNSRWKYLAINFSSTTRTIETLFAITSIFLLPVSLIFKYRQNLKQLNPYLIWGFFLIFIFNTGLMLLTCLAREARLFNISLILFFPFYAFLFFQEVNSLLRHWRRLLKSLIFWLAMLGSAFFFRWFVLHFSKTSTDLTSELLFKYYYFLNLMGFCLIVTNSLLNGRFFSKNENRTS